eukprot:scaffold2821_cov240-Pinguiococcus_pyrenoidosus.AAC.6
MADGAAGETWLKEPMAAPKTRRPLFPANDAQIDRLPGRHASRWSKCTSVVGLFKRATFVAQFEFMTALVTGSNLPPAERSGGKCIAWHPAAVES